MTHSISLITGRGSTLSVHTAGNGQTIILLHGFPLDHRMWLPLMETLSQWFHCVAVDFRGFGGSTLDGEYQLSDLADDVEFVRQHLATEQNIHVLGLSMGGYVALEYWHRYGQHLKSLILSNTRPSGDDGPGRMSRLEMAQTALGDSAWQAISPMLTKLLAPDSNGTISQQRVVEMMRSASASAVAEAQKAMAGRRDFSELIELCKLPTLVVAGQLDLITPPLVTRQWAERLPRSTFHEVAGSGHLTPLEKPIEFQRLLIEFFKSW